MTFLPVRVQPFPFLLQTSFGRRRRGVFPFFSPFLQMETLGGTGDNNNPFLMKERRFFSPLIPHLFRKVPWVPLLPGWRVFPPANKEMLVLQKGGFFESFSGVKIPFWSLSSGPEKIRSILFFSQGFS